MRRQILLGRGIIGGRQSQPRYRWYAPAWAVDGSGYAYANPTLGPELFANGAFSADANWTKGTGWTIAGGVGVGSSASGRLSQNVGDTGIVYRVSFDLVTRTAGSLRPFIGSASGDNITTPGTYISAQAQGATDELGLVPTTFSGTVDNLSAKEILSRDWASVRSSSVSQIGLKIATLPPGNIQILLRMNGDSPTSDNGVSAQIGAGTGAPFRVSLFKVVAGITTSMIGVTPVTFVANALLEIRRSGNIYQLWYNGSQVGTDQTISDGYAGPYCGIYSRDAICRFSEFQINSKKVPFRF